MGLFLSSPCRLTILFIPRHSYSIGIGPFLYVTTLAGSIRDHAEQLYCAHFAHTGKSDLNVTPRRALG